MNLQFQQPFGQGTSTGVTTYQDLHPAGAGIDVIDISVPGAVQPGSAFIGTFTVEIDEPSFGVGIDQPDRCSTGPLSEGFNVQSGVAFQSVPGVDLSENCIGAPSQADAALGQSVITEMEFQMQAPDEPGEYSIEVTLTGADSGLLMDQNFTTVTVDGDDNGDNGNGEPTPPPGNGNGNGGTDTGLLARLVDLAQSWLGVVEGGIDGLIGVVTDILGLLEGAGGFIGEAARDLAQWLSNIDRRWALIVLLVVLALGGAAAGIGTSLNPVSILLNVVESILG